MASKRQKLDGRARAEALSSLGRNSFVTKSGIEKLLKAVRDDGIPETFDRKAQYRARKDMCPSTTTYGELVVTVPVTLHKKDRKGKTVPVAESFGFQNPLAFLAYHCAESPQYADIVMNALEHHPCDPTRPWNVILYQDGVDPSDGLANCHSRKSCVFYWTFSEFGMRALAHEEVWGTVCVTRMHEANELSGRMSELTSKVLDQFFGDTYNIRISGVSVVIKGSQQQQRAHITAKIGVLLADEPALKEMTDCKGHAGHKCCLLCMNATLVNTQRPLHTVSDYAVPISSTKLTDFKLHTNDTIRHVMLRLKDYSDRVKAGTMTNDEFTSRSAVLGWNWSDHNIVLNTRYAIDLASVVMYDWGHTYVCEGVADVEFGKCMKVLAKRRSASTYPEFGTYLDSFTLPKSSPSPSHLFRADAIRNNLRKSSFTASASEFLTLVPIIARYFQAVAAMRDDGCRDVVDSMIAVLWVVVLLQAIKACNVSPDLLAAAISAHYDLFIRAYGAEDARPKHHYALHLPEMLRFFGFLLSTFTHERKHRLVIRYTRGRMNLQSWGKGAIEEITCHQIWELKQSFFMDDVVAKPTGRTLLALREIFPTAIDGAFTLHNKVKCNGGAFSSGDVVALIINGELEVGELLCTVEVSASDGSSSMYSIISRWSKTGNVSHSWMEVTVSDEHTSKIDTDCVDTVLTYRMAGDRSSCSVYLPYELRGL